MLGFSRSVGVAEFPGSRSEERGGIAVKQHDLAVVVAERAGAQPHDVARREKLVEHPGRVARQTGRKDVALQNARGHRIALELADDLVEPVNAATDHRAPHAVPIGQETGERLGRGRLDLLAHEGQRALTQRAHDLDVAPLTLGAVGPERAAQQRTRFHPAFEAAFGVLFGDPETRRHLLGGERTPGARVPHHQRTERTGRIEGILRVAGGPFEERRRKTRWDVHPERFPVTTGVFGRNVAVLIRHPHEGDPTFSDELFQRIERLHFGRVGSVLHLVEREITEASEQVVDRVDAAGMTPRIEDTAVPLRLRRWPSGRATHAVPRSRAARRACRDPMPERPLGVRPGAHRRRT